MRFADLTCIKVLERTTHLHVLWNCVLRFSAEFADLRLVSDKPLLITGSGELYDGPISGITLSSPENVGKRSSLFEELLMIARLLDAEQLPQESIEILEKWSEGLAPILEKVYDIATVEMAAYLRDTNALN